MKRLYQCEKCGEIYEDELTASICEAHPEPVFNYKIGDTVFLFSAYNKKHYAQKVVATFVYKHEASYELDMPIDVGDGLIIGVGENGIVTQDSILYEGTDCLPAQENMLSEYDPNHIYITRLDYHRETTYKP